MFAQVITGRARDSQGLRELLEQWARDLAPGATGFLGSTAGVTADGTALIVARFESEQAARANSDRAEQGQWWSAVEACFDGPVEFADSTEVETFRGGGSDTAGFVQVMRDSGVDRQKLAAFDRLFAEQGDGFRSELVGMVRVWTAPDAYTELIYFTSEAEARAGEAAQPPEELAAGLDGFQDLMADVTFLDLTEPLLYSP